MKNEREPLLSNQQQRVQRQQQPQRGAPRRGQQQQAVMIDFDKASLETEAALQRQKLEEIIEIEQGALEVKECYNELNNLVQAQQAGLDTVETHVDTAGQKVTKGVEELQKANEQQKKSRKRMCCLVMLVMIILAILVIVLVVVVKK